MSDRVNDEQLVAAYEEFQNVWKVGKHLGISGQNAHKRLTELGAMNAMNHFTTAERDRLVAEYQHYRDAGMLSVLSQEMGRTVPFLSRQARDLGLTNPACSKRWLGKWKDMPECVARKLLDDLIESSKTVTKFCVSWRIPQEGFSLTMRRHFPKEWDAVVESKATHGSNKFYDQGRSFEHQTRDELENLGYYVVRSPQSKGIADLVAVRKGEVLFVQCKRSKTIEVPEWNRLVSASAKFGAVPVLANGGKLEVEFWRLLDRKDGSKRRQPRERFFPGAAL